MKLTVFLESGLSGDTERVVKDTLTETYALNLEFKQISKNFVLKFLDEKRNQVRGDLLLEALSRETRGFLAIITEDAFVPHLNFVFGVALPGVGAMVSTYRFWFDADLKVFSMRLYKTIKHELGHFFGLAHCNNPCVMRFSNSLFELDLKPSTYCNVCRGKLLKLGVLK